VIRMMKFLWTRVRAWVARATGPDAGLAREAHRFGRKAPRGGPYDQHAAVSGTARADQRATARRKLEAGR